MLCGIGSPCTTTIASSGQVNRHRCKIFPHSRCTSLDVQLHHAPERPLQVPEVVLQSVHLGLEALEFAHQVCGAAGRASHVAQDQKVNVLRPSVVHVFAQPQRHLGNKLTSQCWEQDPHLRSLGKILYQWHVRQITVSMTTKVHGKLFISAERTTTLASADFVLKQSPDFAPLQCQNSTEQQPLRCLWLPAEFKRRCLTHHQNATLKSCFSSSLRR